MTAVLATTRAELFRLRRWPAVWVIGGAWLLLNLVFVYVFNYLSYTDAMAGFAEGAPKSVLLDRLLPEAVPVALVQGTPMFGGAIMLTLGALAAGSGYGWGTWKTAFTQGRSRWRVLAGTAAALASVVVTVVLVTLAVDLAVSTGIALAQGQALAYPPLAEVLRALLGGLLVLGMWVSAGVALGTLSRGPALAVGLGVVWVLAVENLLRGVAGALDWLAPVTDVLPGSVAGSVVAALGATPVSQGGTPGVVAALGGWSAVGLAAGYLVAFAALTAWLVRRRDIS
ncbi:ABC-type transport system involved in multi-copper enzyme maturation permease subunit [Crossiella equi]|uniref:ABC-type transport system involved in multi-copper enzyme maturation permease subunit n=1 Tax=Crossiella equi TaxID=130796 RepID=A0ABS5AIQ2_9PSEU|nr:ABC transporter permease subunit [Crossiella equi]MBP2476448.1 ABC-type transport system involved in multi-copper enzyme maturation permease subunit [Crossiella equi]